eukprot:916080-Pyramimonas_sp.AAC.1
MLYSYDHCEDLDKHFDPPELDWSDISMIDWPDDLSDLVIPDQQPPRDPPAPPARAPPVPPF